MSAFPPSGHVRGAENPCAAQPENVTARSELGHAEVVFTIPAEPVRQATSTALAVLGTYPWPLRSLRVLTTADFDRLTDAMDLPPLVSVQEAADGLVNDPPGRTEGHQGQGAAGHPCGRYLGASAVRGRGRPRPPRRIATDSCVSQVASSARAAVRVAAHFSS